jgi:hypothetical protein
VADYDSPGGTTVTSDVYAAAVAIDDIARFTE